MFGQVAAVFFVLTLLIATLWFLRRNGVASLKFSVAKGLARHKLLQVVERVPLTPNHSLHLIQIHNRLLLIAVSPAGCAQLESFPSSLLDSVTPAELLQAPAGDSQSPTKP